MEGVKRKLICRVATNRDVKNQTQSGKNSQYYKWASNKEKMGKFVKKAARKEIYNNIREKRRA